MYFDQPAQFILSSARVVVWALDPLIHSSTQSIIRVGGFGSAGPPIRSSARSIIWVAAPDPRVHSLTLPSVHLCPSTWGGRASDPLIHLPASGPRAHSLVCSSVPRLWVRGLQFTRLIERVWCLWCLKFHHRPRASDPLVQSGLSDERVSRSIIQTQGARRVSRSLVGCVNEYIPQVSEQGTSTRGTHNTLLYVYYFNAVNPSNGSRLIQCTHLIGNVQHCS